MRDALNAFLASIPNVNSILARHTEAVALFGFFLSEITGQSITPAAITECYEAARVRAPRNVSDAMNKSGAFVKDRGGWALQRDALTRIKALIPTASSAMNSEGDEERRGTVMVVYGQDEETRRDMFSFLRFLKLEPIK